MTPPQTKRLRVIVDANILVAGTAWPRFPYEVLRHATKGDYQLVLSPQIIEEARYALTKLPPASINVGAFERFLAETQYELVPSPSEAEIAAHLTLVRDPKDIHVALSALVAQVDFLVSQDKDFTDEDESTREVQRLLNIQIPGTFLREQMGWTSEQLGIIQGRTWRELVDRE